MAPGDFGILEPDGVRAVPAQSQRTGRELETFTLVGPLDDGQGGHEAYLLGSDAGHERIMLGQCPRLTHQSISVNPLEACGGRASCGQTACRRSPHDTVSVSPSRPTPRPFRPLPALRPIGPGAGGKAPPDGRIHCLVPAAGNIAHGAAPAGESRCLRASGTPPVPLVGRGGGAKQTEITFAAPACVRPRLAVRRRSGTACRPEIRWASRSIRNP